MSRGKVAVQRILDDVAVDGSGSVFQPWGSAKTFEISGILGSGSGAVDVAIEGSNNQDVWDQIYTANITLGTTRAGATYSGDAPWKYIRATVSNLTGSSPSIRVDMGNLPGF